MPVIRLKSYFFDVVIQNTTTDKYCVQAHNKEEAQCMLKSSSALGGKLLRSRCYKVVKHAAS